VTENLKVDRLIM